MPAMNTTLALRSTYLPALLRKGPTLDFLLPSFSQTRIRRRHVSTANQASEQPASGSDEAMRAKSALKTRKPLSKEQRDYLDAALRVNQAGELAATLIYTHQTPPILRTHPHLRQLMAHMYDQEAGHFSTFNHLLAKHRIRPTAMYPVWVAASSILGWGTGLLGREAAMACTEAVETEIGTHYNDQVRVLLDWVREMEDRGEEVGEEITYMVKNLKRIRDEELEHLDEAVGEGAQEAKPYELLNKIIRGGCKGAIWISQRV